MKIYGVMILFLLSSCSGYFNQGRQSDIQAQSLATEDGQTLSRETSDQISPFLYRDIDGQNPILFYASDQGGDFDIYYAKMNIDGRFQTPQKMDLNINTSNDESFPVVYWAEHENGSKGIVISFIRSTGGISQIETHLLNSTLDSTNSYTTYLTNSVQSIMHHTTNLVDPGVFFLVNSNKTVDWYIYSASSGLVFDQNADFSPLIVESGNGKEVAINSGECYFYMFEIITNNRHQLLTRIMINDPNASLLIDQVLIMPEWSSEANDMHPFVDFFDTATINNTRIYFASDRYMNGHLDLYRYNNNTYDELVDLYPYVSPFVPIQ